MGWRGWWRGCARDVGAAGPDWIAGFHGWRVADALAKTSESGATGTAILASALGLERCSDADRGLWISGRRGDHFSGSGDRAGLCDPDVNSSPAVVIGGWVGYANLQVI